MDLEVRDLDPRLPHNCSILKLRRRDNAGGGGERELQSTKSSDRLSLSWRQRLRRSLDQEIVKRPRRVEYREVVSSEFPVITDDRQGRDCRRRLAAAAAVGGWILN